MKKIILFALLVLSASLFSESCGESIGKYLESKESYSQTQVNVEGGYILFSIDGKYTMLAQCAGEPAYLSDSEEVKAVLMKYASTLEGDGSELKGDVEGMLKSLDSFAGSRSDEEICGRYTGIDRFPCHDRESCIESCYTPMCNDMKHSTGCEVGGENCGFVDGIVEFSNSVEGLDNGSVELKEILGKLEGAEGTALFERGIGVADRMLGLAKGVNENVLMRTPEEDGFYFCPKVKYNTDALESIRGKLVEWRNRHSLLLEPGSTAEYIASETKRRVELRADIDECSVQVSYAEKAIKEVTGTGHRAVNYSEVRQAIAEMEGAGNRLSSACSSRRFPEADNAFEEFKNAEGSAKETLSYVSSQYDELENVYNEVWNRLMEIPPEANSTELYESMKLVEREMGMVSNVSDICVLKGVLLENNRTIGELSNPPRNPIVDFGLPLVLALAVTVGLYLVMRKSKRGL